MAKQSYKIITLANSTRHRAISCPTRKTIPSAPSGISKGTVKAPEVKLTRSQKKLRREQARIMREAQFAAREYPKGKGQRSGTLSSSFERCLMAKPSKSQK